MRPLSSRCALSAAGLGFLGLVNMNLHRIAKRSAVLAFSLGGCATVDPRADMDRTSQHLKHAIGTETLYRQDDHAVIDQRIADLTAGGLTADEAVQVALLNNPRLQTTVYRLGISRADFVQSELFTNPSLSFSLRWPDGGGLTNLQAGIAQNVAELWQIKHRKEAAQRDLDRTVLDVARDASMLALDVRVAYWRAVRVDRESELARENLSLGQKLIDVAISRREAGAGSDVDVNLARSQHIDLEFKLRSTVLSAIEAHAVLAKLLGLTQAPGEIVLTDALIDPGTWTLTADTVITTARHSRLDVQATRMAAEAAEARVAYEKSRFVRSLEVGLSTERSARNSRGGRDWLAESAYSSAQAGQLTPPSLQPREDQSTDWVVGPEIGAELPIFDQNQAQIARAEYVHQQALRMLEALERELTQDAHVVLKRANTAADNADFYKESALPLREQGLALAQGAYTAGRTTLLAVQEAQRALLSARFGYVEAMTNHALAIVELERVAGRPFAMLVNSAASPNPNGEPMPTEPTEDRQEEKKP